MSERKRPGFVLYTNTARVLSELPIQDAGELIQAICQFELSGMEHTFDDPILGAVFQGIKADLEEDARKYRAKCEQNKENIQARWNSE